MANLSGLVQQLKQERDRVEKQLSGLNAALAAFVGVYRGAEPARKRGKPSSAAKRQAPLAAQTVKQSGKAKSRGTKPKRTMSLAARRKIARAQRARWAARKAEQKKSA
jgi:hypothetical protein